MSDFNRDNNRAVWFDIPVSDLDRATSFYNQMLGAGVQKESFENFSFSVIEHKDGNGGCLVPRPDEISSDRGILIYLNVHGRIKDAVSKTSLTEPISTGLQGAPQVG